MRIVRSTTTVLGLLMLASPGYGEPMLLASFDAIEAGASAPATEFRVQIVLRNDLFPDFEPVDIGFGTFWEDGNSGVVEIGRSDENFDEMARRVTDGVDQFLSTIVFAEFGGAGGGAMESQRFELPGDLIGNELEFIRLLVHSVSIEPYQSPHSELEGIMWDVDVTWEFWGQLIPEPWTITFMAWGLLVVRSHRSLNCADG